MKVRPTALSDVLLIEPDVYRDERGFFLETYHADKYRALGINGPFVQDNHSRSIRGTVRGLHIQVGSPVAKLIRVIEGEIFDVAVDVRVGSSTFGRFVSTILTAETFVQCYVPAGFAHGFAVTSAVAQVEYKCTGLYDPTCDVGIRWNDPAIGIPWPVSDPILSDRDRVHPLLAEQLSVLPK